MLRTTHQWVVLAEYPGAPTEPHRELGPAPAENGASLLSMLVCGESCTRLVVAVTADDEDDALAVGRQVAEHYGRVFRLPDPTDLTAARAT